MISSGDVSGVFAAQQQGFTNQLAYANRIGIPGAGIGMFGAPPAGGAPGFSYGPGAFSGPGFGSGNRFAGGVVSGAGMLSGAASFGSSYLGLAGMLPQSAARFLPFGSFAASTGGVLASGGLSLLAAGIGAGVHGAQQGLAFSNSLGNYNFFNPSTRGGMGFGRGEASGLSQMTRSMAEIPGMLTSMEELTSILGKLKSTGLMQGTTSANEFSHRFKQAISTIRETARILGSTMEEAEGFFAHSRSVGFLGRSDQLKNALNVQLTSGLTGMNVGQVMGLQASGANLATSLGARRSFGARAITSIAQNIGSAQRNGLLSDEMVQDLTGLSGSEGVAAASERMTGLMSRMAMGTSAGQFMLAGMTRFSGGRATLDESVARQFNAGLISFGELQRRGMNLTDAQKISFRARQGDLATSFAGSVGPGGMSRFLGGLVGGRGEDAENLLIQMNGGNAADADFMHRMRGAGTEMEFSQMSKLRSSEANIRERTSPAAIFKRVMTKIHAGTFGPIERFGDDIRTSISQSFDEVVDDFVGRHVVSLSRATAAAFSRSMTTGNNDELHAMFGAASGLGPVSRSMSSRISGALFGHGSSNETIGRLLGGSSAGNLGGATGGEGLVGIIDNLKAGNRNFQHLDVQDQMLFLRQGLKNAMDAGQASPSMTAAQLSIIERNGGKTGALAVRIARALQQTKGPAKDIFTNAIASAEKLTTGPRLRLSELYDSEAVKLSRDVEGLSKAQRDSEDNLHSAGMSRGAIAAMKDSGAVRRAFGKIASGDESFERLLWSDDSDAMRKLNLSAAELDAIREYHGEVKRASGKGLSSALQSFDTAQAAGGISVIAKSYGDAGAEALAGAEEIRNIPGLKGYADQLATAGSAMRKFNTDRSEDSLNAAKGSVGELLRRVISDKNLSPEQKSMFARYAGTIGGAIANSGDLKGIKGKRFTKDQLAERLGLNDDAGRELLEKLEFSSSGSKVVDSSTFDKLLIGTTDHNTAKMLSQFGQSNMAGETREDRIISVLQRIDANQSTVATLLAKLAGYSESDGKHRIEELMKSYLEQERTR
jgi:hypothetical protein